MSRRLTWFGLLAAGLLTATSIGIVACVDQPDTVEVVPECALPADAVSPELLAYLSMARAAHLRADLAMADAETGPAITALEELVDSPLPGGKPTPETREVVADALARTAELRSSAGKFDEAVADITWGLKLATERTHFRGRLLEVLGAVEARRLKQIKADIEELKKDAAPDAVALAKLQETAEATKKRAIKASMDAIDIQEEVINKALDEDLEGLPQDPK